jgi:hypothetical protein
MFIGVSKNFNGDNEELLQRRKTLADKGKSLSMRSDEEIDPNLIVEEEVMSESELIMVNEISDDEMSRT